MRDADLLAALTAANSTVAATDPQTLDRSVPGCPGWTVEDLVEHLSQVQRWATRILLAPPGEKVPRRVDVAPTGPEVLTFFAEGAAALVDALTAVDLDGETFTFVGPNPRRWWLRRQAHEAVVHAWDLQDATGTATAIDPVVAVDGIDELFEVFLGPRLLDPSGFASAGESIHVHTTDVDGEWLLRVAPGTVELTREHAKGDLALRGPASDVLVVLWNRRPVEETAAEVFGAADLLDRLRAAGPF